MVFPKHATRFSIPQKVCHSPFKQKDMAETVAQTGGIVHKRKAEELNSDDEADEVDEYESDHPCEAVHKMTKIGHDGVGLKEKKAMKSIESLGHTDCKHGHCKVTKCENCDEPYGLCFKDQTCQYHPCEHSSRSHFCVV